MEYNIIEGVFYVKLFLSIVSATFLIIVFLMISPIFAVIVLGGIALGCIFRGLYMLNEIHEQIVPKEDKVKEAVKRHLEERKLGKNS